MVTAVQIPLTEDAMRQIRVELEQAIDGWSELGVEVAQWSRQERGVSNS
jgi:hypothetical protein